MRARVAAAIVLGLRADAGVLLGYRLEPDTALYLGGAGSSWFYPSPFGRLVGSLGFGWLAVFNVVCAAALGVVVVALAQRSGTSGYGALALLCVLPGGWYVQVVALDTAGALAVCCAVLFAGRWGTSAGLVALLLHPASALGWAGWRVWRGGTAALLTLSTTAACALVAALLTPYAGILTYRGWDALYGISTTGMAALLPIALLVRLGVVRLARCPALTAGIWSLSLALVVAMMQGNFQMRYLLPATALVAASSRTRWPSWLPVRRGVAV